MKWPQHRLKGIENVPEPREVAPLHLEVPDPLGRGVGTVDLEKIPREILLENWEFPPLEPKSMKNLQTWINHLGPALYNPIWWREHEIPLPPRRTRYPWRVGKYEHLHGGHRCRSLERLQLPFIFVYIHRGPTYVNPSNPNWRSVSHLLQENDREPRVYTKYGICDECGAQVTWSGPLKTGDRRTSGAEGFKSTVYTCRKCGYMGQRPEIYPEPV